jgi:hypothetical protein
MLFNAVLLQGLLHLPHLREGGPARSVRRSEKGMEETACCLVVSVHNCKLKQEDAEAQLWSTGTVILQLIYSK